MTTHYGENDDYGEEEQRPAEHPSRAQRPSMSEVQPTPTGPWNCAGPQPRALPLLESGQDLERLVEQLASRVTRLELEVSVLKTVPSSPSPGPEYQWTRTSVAGFSGSD